MTETTMTPVKGSLLSITHVVSRDMLKLSAKTRLSLDEEYTKVADGLEIVKPIADLVDVIKNKWKVLVQWSDTCVNLRHHDFTMQELDALYETVEDLKTYAETGMRIENSLAMRYRCVAQDQFLRGRLRFISDDVSKLMLRISEERDKLYREGQN